MKLIRIKCLLVVAFLFIAAVSLFSQTKTISFYGEKLDFATLAMAANHGVFMYCDWLGFQKDQRKDFQDEMIEQLAGLSQGRYFFDDVGRLVGRANKVTYYKRGKRNVKGKGKAIDMSGCVITYLHGICYEMYKKKKM